MTAGQKGDWQSFARGFDQLGPPLRPSPSDVETLRAAIAAHDERVLLLGVTPELATLGKTMLAVDKVPQMLAKVWPGDDQRRRAICEDWLSLPLGDGRFDAVVGDGSLNAVAEQGEELLREVRRVLAPGGILALRVFCAPDRAESMQEIREDVDRGWTGNVWALAWRLAMSIAAGRTSAIVGVREILDAFEGLFPDREALANSTGWSQQEITFFDRFRGAERSLRFPTAAAAVDLLQRGFRECRILPASGYPLSERCPAIVCSA